MLQHSRNRAHTRFMVRPVPGPACAARRFAQHALSSAPRELKSPHRPAAGASAAGTPDAEWTRAVHALHELSERPPQTPHPGLPPWNGRPATYRLAAVDGYVRNNPSFRWVASVHGRRLTVPCALYYAAWGHHFYIKKRRLSGMLPHGCLRRPEARPHACLEERAGWLPAHRRGVETLSRAGAGL